MQSDLPLLIQHALASGIGQVRAAGSPLHPFFLDENRNVFFLVDEAGSNDPMQLALLAIKAKAPDIRRCALVMDTRITTPDRRKWDAILVIACDRDADEGEAWAQRYVLKSFFREFRVAGEPELIGKAKNFIRVALEG